MSDNDGIDDALRNAAQLTAGMLARLGEAQSRASQQHAIDQEHAVTAASTRAEQQARKAAAREEVAMARLRLVHDPNWWASATIGQVGDTWQITDAYRGHPDADSAREVMTREIATHWRVIPEVDAVSGAVRRLLEQAEHDRQQERVEELRAGQDRNQGRTVEDEADGEFRHAQQANNAAELRSEKADGADEIGEGEQEGVRADSFDPQSVNGTTRPNNDRRGPSATRGPATNAPPKHVSWRTRAMRGRRCMRPDRCRVADDDRPAGHTSHALVTESSVTENDKPIERTMLWIGCVPVELSGAS